MENENNAFLPESNTSTRRQSFFENVWEHYKIWDITAIIQQKKIKLARFIMMGLIISITFTSTLGGFLSLNQRKYDEIATTLLIISAVLSALATIISFNYLNGKKEKTQVRARAAAETIKSEIYKYLLRIGQYRQNAENTLIENISQTNLSMEGEIYPILTKKQKLEGILPIEYSIEKYISERIKGQIYNYYEKKVTYYRWYFKYLRLIFTGFTFLGSVIGLYAAISGDRDFGVWVAFAVTSASAIGSYIASNRYDFLIASYLHTITNLKIYLTKWNLIENPNHEDIENFVLDCEAEFMRENQTWVLELSKNDSEISFENARKSAEKNIFKPI